MKVFRCRNFQHDTGTAIPPLVLDSLQLQVNPKTQFFYFSPFIPLNRHYYDHYLFHSYSWNVMNLWFSSRQCFISPWSGLGICRLSCSWTPWFFYSLWWKRLVTCRPSQSPSSSVWLLLPELDTQTQLMCLTFTRQTESRWCMEPCIITPLFFLEPSIWSKLKICFKY